MRRFKPFIIFIIPCGLLVSAFVYEANNQAERTYADYQWVENGVTNPGELDTLQFRADAVETFNGTTVWLRLEHEQHLSTHPILKFDTTQIDDIQIWLQLAGQWQKVGEHNANASLLSSSTRPSLDLTEFVDDQPTQLLVRLSGIRAFSPSLRFVNQQQLNQFSVRTIMAESVGLGALFIFGIYGLLVLGVSRDQDYLWLSLYCVSTFVFLSHYLGYAQLMFGPGYWQANEAVANASSFLVYGTYFCLGLRLLRFTWYKLSYVFLAVMSITAVLTLFAWHPTMFAIGTLVGGLFSMAIMPLSLYRWVQGDGAGRDVFLAVVASFIGGTTLWYSEVGGGQPSEFAFAFMLYGINTTVFLLVVMLAQRLRGLREQLTEQIQQQMLAQQEAADANALASTKSAFLATMSHEIRTPMNGVLGMSTLLAETQLDDEQQRYVDTLNRSGQSLMSILDDVLDYSKFESGKFDLEVVSVNLLQLIEDCLTPFKTKADAKNVKLVLSGTEDIPKRIQCDPTRFKQVLSNLVSNAVKFTQSGSVRVELAVTDDAPQKPGYLLVSVEDSGIGIAADQIDTLFDRFSQADSSITRKFGGTGLGLAICRLLARAMGGEVKVASELGQGSTFTFTLPLLIVQEHEKPNHSYSSEYQLGDANSVTISQANEAVSSDLLPLQDLKILVAEDEKTNQMVAKKLLTKLGGKVDIANHGLEALSMCTDNSYDVVLMDCEMPELDGYSTCREIKRRKLSGAPIIAVTAHATNEYRKMALRAGMDAYLAKPFRKDDLVTAILMQLEDKKELKKV